MDAVYDVEPTLAGAHAMTSPNNAGERYISAGNTSNLRVLSHQTKHADIIIAAGWSPFKMGAALLRLCGEWDAIAKPNKPTKKNIELFAQTLDEKVEVDGQMLPRKAAATKIANEWYLREVNNMVGRLISLPMVRQRLRIRAHQWSMQDPQGKAGTVLKYWLDQTCPACDGRLWRLQPGVSSLSNKKCMACNGTGLGLVPCGAEGRRLANYLDYCVSRAQASIGFRARK